MRLSGFTVLKNGVSLGYPFVESILSLLPACDEFVISEGFSDDDTHHWLTRLQQKFPAKIRLFRDRWPDGLTGGQAIGKMQTRALRRCRGRWAYLLQADELMPEENLPALRQICAPRMAVERLIGRRRFSSYNVDFLHVYDNFQHAEFDPGYRWAIRLVRRRSFPWSQLISSRGDGWQMQGPGCSLVGTARLPRPVVHVGYNFPVNVWQKQINHARLYPEHAGYQEKAHLALQQLRAYQHGNPPPLPTTNPLQLPRIIAPLIGQAEYHVREELLA